jgi:cytochrome b-561
VFLFHVEKDKKNCLGRMNIPSLRGVSDMTSYNQEEDSFQEDDPVISNTVHDESIQENNWMDKIAYFQAVANIVCHLLALLSIVLVSWWVDLSAGLSWKLGEAKRVFNYHPLCMVLAFTFMTVATLSFRYPKLHRYLQKVIHGLSWTVACLCGVIGLVAVFRSHNDEQSGLIANLYSFHSWIGITVVTLFLLQYILAIYAFGGVFHPPWKAKAIYVHKYIGPIIYQAVAVTMILGIQEKEGFVGCAYQVEKPDTFPIQHINKIPLTCRVSHSLGLVIVIMTLLASFAIHDFGKSTIQSHHVL